MGWVKIRVPRTSQPQDACGIDWNNPIARGLICLLIDAGASKINLVNNSFGVRANDANASLKTVKDFSSVEYSNSWDSFPVNASGLTQFSAACLAVKTDASSYVVGGPFGASQSGEALRAFSVESGNGFPSSSTYYSLWSDGGSRYNIFAGSTPLTPHLSPQVLMMTLANSTAKAYSNGALVGSGAGPATLQTIYSLAAGANTGIAGNFWGGIVPITSIWSRELSAAEAKSFAENPWQIFEPEELTIWVPDAVGSGGAATVIPIGVQANSAIGTPLAIGGSSIPATVLPAGVVGLAYVGSPVATGQARAYPLGVQATGAVGSPVVTAGGSAVAQPQGVAASSSVGAPVARGAAVACPLGLAGYWSVGQPVAIGQSAMPATAYPAGVSATGYVGTPVAFEASDATPSIHRAISPAQSYIATSPAQSYTAVVPAQIYST